MPQLQEYVVVGYLVVRQSDRGDRRPGVARAIVSRNFSLTCIRPMLAVADFGTGDD